MTFKDILAISGQSGLFCFVSQSKNGIIVEGIEDKKRMNAFSHFKVSSLDDIAVFTDSGEVPLRKVFKKIHELENGGAAIDVKKNDKELKSYFEKILPDYERDRVYVSDMKKIITWYNLLQRNNFSNFEDEEVSKETVTE